MATHRFFLAATALAAAFVCTPAAWAAPVALPAAGSSSFAFTFDATAAVDEVFDTDFQGALGQGGWTVLLPTAARLDAWVQDDFEPGDEFELLVNGSVVAWTTAGSPMDFFRGELAGHVLAAGEHSFTLRATRFAFGFEGGGAYAGFSLSAAPTQGVPLPATLPLVATALAGLALLAPRRRRG